MTDLKEYTFPDCMHRFVASMHIEGVDPGKIEVVMPFKEWWTLHCALERKFKNLMVYDGRGELSHSFQYMGVKFVSKGNK